MRRADSTIDDPTGFAMELPPCLRPKGERPTVREAAVICDWYKDQAAMRATRVAATAERESGVIGLEHD